jgi:hypothetical protein
VPQSAQINTENSKKSNYFVSLICYRPRKIWLRTGLRGKFAAVIRSFRIPKRLDRASRFDAP